ncbi:MAG: ABC transporter ATP-binding protein [Kiloniellales bacterium]
MSALLEIVGLEVRFNAARGLVRLASGAAGIQAVAGVSLSVEEGRTFAIVGESGSGKTTLARAVNGLVPASAGSIRFRGRELTRLSEGELKPVRREIAMMFQDPVGSLSPRLSVRALLEEPFRVHGMTDRNLAREVERLLALVGLPPVFAARYPHQLSGGQARRVGVARALALEPKLIMADEPTAGLDVSVQGEILNLLNDLQERLGIAILIITHNLHVVRHVAHAMAIMYLGRVVEKGPTDRIFGHPTHPYTLALLSANPEPDPDAARNQLKLEGEIPSLLSRPSGCEFHTRCPFVATRCREERPALVERAGRLAACHFPR